MASSTFPHPRQLLRMGPHDRSHWPALRVVVSVLAPLVVVTAADRQDLALFAVFGAFASVYGRAESHRSRFRSQAVVGAGLVVCIGAGAAVATAGAVRPWLAVVVAALIAALGSLASDALRWRPPGSFFLVFAFGAVASVPTPEGLGRHVLVAVGVSAAAAAFAVAVGTVGAIPAGNRRLTPPPPAAFAATLRRPGAWLHASRYLIGALVAGGIATAAGLGHPYWAALTAVVPMAAPDTTTRLLRAGHRLIGTAFGLVVAAGLLALHPTGWLLVGIVGAAQFGAELFVMRNYSLTLLFVTPLALLMTALGGNVDPSQLLVDRAIETVLGVAVGIGATLLWSERERSDLAGPGSRS
ncbi:MAG TPA: FUSC family protein [Propionibacteriaceae bacterium]